MSTDLKPKTCYECELGEHDNYDDDVIMTTVIDPDTKKVETRGYMCSEHRLMYLYDGYIVNGETFKSMYNDRS